MNTYEIEHAERIARGDAQYNGVRDIIAELGGCIGKEITVRGTVCQLDAIEIVRAQAVGDLLVVLKCSGDFEIEDYGMDIMDFGDDAGEAAIFVINKDRKCDYTFNAGYDDFSAFHAIRNSVR